MAPGQGGSEASAIPACSPSSICAYCLHTHTIATGYTHAYGGSASNPEMNRDYYGVLVLYIIWSLVLIVLLIRSRCTKWPSLQAAMFFLLVAFALVCIHLPTRFHQKGPAVVVAMQRLAMPLLLVAVFMPLEPGSVSKVTFYPLLGAYAILNVAYLIFNFLVFPDTVIILDYHKELDEVYPIIDEEELYDVDTVVKLGLAADFLALALAVFIWVSVGISFVRRAAPKQYNWVLVAAIGLVQATLFQVIIVTRFTLWNLNIIKGLEGCSDYTDPPFRDTVDGFPVIEAVLGPLGLALACAAIVQLQRM